MYKITHRNGQVVKIDLDSGKITQCEEVLLGQREVYEEQDWVSKRQQRQRLAEVFSALMKVIDNAEVLVGKPRDVFSEVIYQIQEAILEGDKQEEKRLRKQLNNIIGRGCRNRKGNSNDSTEA